MSTKPSQPVPAAGLRVAATPSVDGEPGKGRGGDRGRRPGDAGRLSGSGDGRGPGRYGCRAPHPAARSTDHRDRRTCQCRLQPHRRSRVTPRDGSPVRALVRPEGVHIAGLLDRPVAEPGLDHDQGGPGATSVVSATSLFGAVTRLHLTTSEGWSCMPMSVHTPPDVIRPAPPSASR